MWIYRQYTGDTDELRVLDGYMDITTLLMHFIVIIGLFGRLVDVFYTQIVRI